MSSHKAALPLPNHALWGSLAALDLRVADKNNVLLTCYTCLLQHIKYSIIHKFERYNLLRTRGYSRLRQVNKQTKRRLPSPTQPAWPGYVTNPVYKRPSSGQHYLLPGKHSAWSPTSVPRHAWTSTTPYTAPGAYLNAPGLLRTP